MAIIIALAAMLLMSALGASLVLTTSSEAMIAANFHEAQAGMYAAEAAFERALDDLSSIDDWDLVLGGVMQSGFVDGPPGGPRALADGSTLDLVEAINLANCRRVTTCSASNLVANTASRPWGANNPVWRLFAYGPIGSLLPSLAVDSGYYAIVMVADDPAENDADPLHDGSSPANPGSGLLTVRAEAFGPRRARQIIQATVERAGPAEHMRIVAWQLLR